MSVYGNPQTEALLDYWGRYHNVDPILGRVILRKESSLGQNPKAYQAHDGGITGPAQLSPGVVAGYNKYAAQNGLPPVTNPNDMAQAIPAGMWYLRQGLDAANAAGAKVPAAYAAAHYFAGNDQRGWGPKTANYIWDASNKHGEYPAGPGPAPAATPAATAQSSSSTGGAAATARQPATAQPSGAAAAVPTSAARPAAQPVAQPVAGPAGSGAAPGAGGWADLIAQGKAPASMAAAPPSAFASLAPPGRADLYSRVSTPEGYAAQVEQLASAAAGAKAGRAATGGGATNPTPRATNAPANATPTTPPGLPAPTYSPMLPTSAEPVTTEATAVAHPGERILPHELPDVPGAVPAPRMPAWAQGRPGAGGWGYEQTPALPTAATPAPPNLPPPVPGMPGAPQGTAGISGPYGAPSGEGPPDIPPIVEGRRRYPEQRSSFWGALLPPTANLPTQTPIDVGNALSYALTPDAEPGGALGSPLTRYLPY